MKHLCKIIFTILLTDIGLMVSAQNDTLNTDTVFNGHVVSSDWIDYGLTVGVDFSRYLYGEIGYYRSDIWELGGFPTLSTTMIYGAEFSNFDKFVVAPKIQGRIHAYFFNASLTGLYYTDLEGRSTIRLRPEIGVGLWNLDINYGYNIGIYSNDFSRFNKHVIGIRYYIKLYRKYGNEYDWNGNIRP